LDKGEVKLSSNLSKYFEVDFPEITMKKAMWIKKRKELSCLLDDIDQVKIERGGMDLKGSSYCMLGADLRNWSDIANRLVDAGLDLK
jgi:tRNA wybutosine-synthesizing protein 4